MLDYATVLNAAFLHRYGDGKSLSATDRMNMRYDLAKSLLNQKYSHLISELEERAIEQHNADMDEWRLILDGVSVAEDVSRYVSPLYFGNLRTVDSPLHL